MDGDNLDVNQNLEMEEQTQNPQGDNNNPDILDNKNDDTQDKQEEQDIFDHTKMTFDNVETSFNGYDLSSLKEKIDTNEDSVKALESYTSKFQELGLSQEQVLGIVSFMAEQGEQVQSPQDIKEELNKHLTFEEKRAYQANCNLLQRALKGTPEEKFFNAIASDPYAIKVLGRVINFAKGGNNVSAAKTERETRVNTYISGDKAVDIFNKYLSESLGKGIDDKEKAKKANELRSMLATEEDKKYFNEIITY
ncbi:hypothetical protein [Fusobacterium polymorphum]|uniref:hypothetical protein n=1 Tax=Fusobacterium nucleatum subsp. polymorphum TaxID=76857 RepID=UPI00300AF037